MIRAQHCTYEPTHLVGEVLRGGGGTGQLLQAMNTSHDSSPVHQPWAKPKVCLLVSVVLENYERAHLGPNFYRLRHGHHAAESPRSGSDHPSGAAAGMEPEGCCKYQGGKLFLWKCGNLGNLFHFPDAYSGGSSAQYLHRRAQSTKHHYRHGIPVMKIKPVEGQAASLPAPASKTMGEGGKSRKR